MCAGNDSTLSPRKPAGYPGSRGGEPVTAGINQADFKTELRLKNDRLPVIYLYSATAGRCAGNDKRGVGNDIKSEGR